MDFLKPAKYFFLLSGAATAISILLLLYPGPILSIEFTGGTRMEISMDGNVTAEKVQEAIVELPGTALSPTVNKLGNGQFLVKMRDLNDETRKSLEKHLGKTFENFTIRSYTVIGPTVGSTLKFRAFIALIVASAGIILYIAMAFRKIPRRYSPWKFGITAVVTLLHDVMITVGIFVILSHITNFEVDTLFVTALLTILGYSVNDTIIVFDRIRDNLLFEERKESFAEVCNRSVNQTWKRSCYTSFSTLIVLTALFLFGSHAIQWFVLTLIIGIALGTYSSIFVATPLLVYWNDRSKKY